MVVIVGLASCLGCSTRIGTTVVADRLLPRDAIVEPVGLVSVAIWDGHFLWAAPAGRELYEAARQKALDQNGGNVLINAKVTTRLTSFVVFYKTEIVIDGTSAVVKDPPRPGG